MTLQLLQQEWAKDAACRFILDPAPYHPDKATPRAEVRAVKRICAHCPVKAQCLRDAVDRDEAYGIWGGTTPRERRRLAESQHAVAAF